MTDEIIESKFERKKKECKISTLVTCESLMPWWNISQWDLFYYGNIFEIIGTSHGTQNTISKEMFGLTRVFFKTMTFSKLLNFFIDFRQDIYDHSSRQTLSQKYKEINIRKN